MTAWCSPSLQLSRVALMFLTVGNIYHETLWTEWLEEANNVLPVRFLNNATGTSSLLSTLTKECGDKQWQALFSVYTHPKPEFAGFDSNSSMFAGTEVTGCIQVCCLCVTTSLYLLPYGPSPPRKTNWGGFSLIEALRIMLRQALQDARNVRFVLLSDSSIPLYPATFTWLQLVTERKSRVDACNLPVGDEAGVCVGIWSISPLCTSPLYAHIHTVYIPAWFCRHWLAAT